MPPTQEQAPSQGTGSEGGSQGWAAAAQITDKITDEAEPACLP